MTWFWQWERRYEEQKSLNELLEERLRSAQEKIDLLRSELSTLYREKVISKGRK